MPNATYDTPEYFHSMGEYYGKTAVSIGKSSEEISFRQINFKDLNLEFKWCKKILGINEAGDTGLWEEFKILLLQVSQRLPLKFKAPQNVVDNTPSHLNFNEITTDWEKTRTELKALLEKLDDHLA